MGEVIPGWDEGLLRMSLGEKATLRVRSDMAYGPLACLERLGIPGTAGAGCIPPKSDLMLGSERQDLSTEDL